MTMSAPTSFRSNDFAGTSIATSVIKDAVRRMNLNDVCYEKLCDQMTHPN